MAEATAHQKKLEWSESIDKVETALRLAHRSKEAMKMKVRAMLRASIRSLAVMIRQYSVR